MVQFGSLNGYLSASAQVWNRPVSLLAYALTLSTEIFWYPIDSIWDNQAGILHGFRYEMQIFHGKIVTGLCLLRYASQLCEGIRLKLWYAVLSRYQQSTQQSTHYPKISQKMGHSDKPEDLNTAWFRIAAVLSDLRQSVGQFRRFCAVPRDGIWNTDPGIGAWRCSTLGNMSGIVRTSRSSESCASLYPWHSMGPIVVGVE